MPLAVHACQCQHHPDEQCHESRRVDPELGQVLDRVDDRHDRCQGQDGRDQIEPAGVRIPGLGQEQESSDDQHYHHRHVDEEDRSPPEVLKKEAAEQRPQRGPASGCRRPDGDGEGAFPPGAGARRTRVMPSWRPPDGSSSQTGSR